MQSLSQRVDQLAQQLDKLTCYGNEKLGAEGSGSTPCTVVAGREQEWLGRFWALFGYRRVVQNPEQTKLMTELQTIASQLKQFESTYQLQERHVCAINSPQFLTRQELQTFVDNVKSTEAYAFEKIWTVFDKAIKAHTFQGAATEQDWDAINKRVSREIKGIPRSVIDEVMPAVGNVALQNMGNSSALYNAACKFDPTRNYEIEVKSWQDYQRDFPYSTYQNRKNVMFYDSGKPYYEFTNFYQPATPLIIDGMSWPTTEHYFQGCKFPLGSYHRTAVSQLPSARAAFDYARTNGIYRDQSVNWHGGYKQAVMLETLRAKAIQDPHFRQKLVGTGKLPLYEDTRRSGDADWGIGTYGSGQNLLGFMLMQVRDEINAGMV